MFLLKSRSCLSYYNTKIKILVKKKLILKFSNFQGTLHCNIYEPYCLFSKKKKKFIILGASCWKVFQQEFIQIIKGIVRTWYFELKILGTGYKIRLHEDSIQLDVGYSHSIFIKILNNLNLELKKKILIIKSNNLKLIKKLITILCSVSKIDRYSGKGIFLKDFKLQLKEGKIWQK